MEQQALSAADRTWYMVRSELEHSAARKRNQRSPGIGGRSESLRYKRVRIVNNVSPQGNGWRCNAFPFSVLPSSGRSRMITLRTRSTFDRGRFPGGRCGDGDR